LCLAEDEARAEPAFEDQKVILNGPIVKAVKNITRPFLGSGLGSKLLVRWIILGARRLLVDDGSLLDLRHFEIDRREIGGVTLQKGLEV